MYNTQRISNEAEAITEPVNEASALARKLRLNPYPVNYWVVDYDEMDELIAYGGFQTRYPHWRWGMAYDHQQKQGQLGMGKAFEIVNNDDPANAFLQVSNTMADQKAVITHVEAHADFFANNEWFSMFRGDSDGVGAVSMLAEHADRIESYMNDPDIDRGEVEEYIDSVSSIADTINQHRPYPHDDSDNIEGADIEASIDALEFSDVVRGQVFDDEWLDAQNDGDDEELPEPTGDVLKFLALHGEEYDETRGRAVEMPDWKQDIIRMLRRESYYFAPQKMTKVLNEGWAAYWESIMMGNERFADADEFVTYADHMARVLGSGGLNPYELGLDLWQYAENKTNRAEVIDKLLRVEGITWRTLVDRVDLREVVAELEPDDCLVGVDTESLDELEALCPDPRIDADALERAQDGEIDIDAHPWKVFTYEGLVERNYSLVRPENRSFLPDITRSELEELARYILVDDEYETVDEAIAAVDKGVGWERMRDIRASHNDVTFLDEYLTEEFVRRNGYFAYEYSHATESHHVSSTEYEDIKKNLLLKFTNFGKPTIVALDHNYNNRNELLLGHMYNGIMLDMDKALKVLARIYELWGRPVNLATIVKEVGDDGSVDHTHPGTEVKEPETIETSQCIHYDGHNFDFEPLAPELEQIIRADDVDYNTLPSEWTQHL